MKKIISSIIAIFVVLGMSAQNVNMSIQVGSTTDVKSIPVTLCMDNNVEILGLQATFSLPEGLTKDKFCYDEDEEMYFSLSNRVTKNHIRNTKELFKTSKPNDLSISIVSDNGSMIKDTSGEIGTFWFDGRSLADGTYTVKMYDACAFPDRDSRIDAGGQHTPDQSADYKGFECEASFTIKNGQVSSGGDSKVGESSIVIEQDARDDYESTVFNVDLTTIANALQCNTSQIELKAKDSEGNYASSTATKGGYWFDRNGYVITYSFGSNDEAFYIEPVEEGDLSKLNIGQYPLRFKGGEEMSAILYFVYESKSYEYKVTLKISKCSTPQIIRDGTSNRVTITCEIEGATIYYTTNGTTPTTSSTKYTGQITVSQNCTIKAIAVKSGYTNSDVATFNVDWVTSKVGYSSIVIEQEVNNGSPLDESYESTSFNVNITDIAAALQCDLSQIELKAKDSEANFISSTAKNGGYWFNQSGYVTTWSSSNSDAAFFIEPIEAGDLSVLRIGQYPSRFNGGEEMSVTLYFTYGLNHYEYNVTLKIKSKDTSICATPKIVRDGTSNRVIMSCATAGATIYYTTDGATPTTSSMKYTGPIAVSQNCIIKAIAICDGYEDSKISSCVWFNRNSTYTKINKTSLIQNNDCSELTGWNYWGHDIPEYGELWRTWHVYSGNYSGNEASMNDKFIERWVYNDTKLEDGVLSQSINGLADGWYLVEADVIACQQGSSSTYNESGTYLFAASNSVRDSVATLTGNGIPEHYSVPMYVENGELTVGFETINSQMNWIAIDNWKLYFLNNDANPICQTPTISRDGTSNRVIMNCATAGASIYYTTNGTTPTENNTRYEGAVTVDHNCTIKAIAIKDGFKNSNVTTFSVNWFKVATPTFSYNNLQLTISTETEGATIYYTTNGSTPTTSSTKYTGPISLTDDCTVKAIAIKADFNNSDVATYNYTISMNTCQAPVISRDGTSNQVVMTCATSGVSIYYTIDGTTPTTSSTRYTGPLSVDHNLTIRAIAMKDGMFNSAQRQFDVDWFKVETPTFTLSNLQLTISTTTSGAIIYYTTNGSDPLADLSRAIRYTAPVRLEADAVVKAVGVKTDFSNSDVATYMFVKADYTCQPPTIQRDGTTDRLIMSCDDENAAIYYTTDGSNPTESSTRYTGPVTMTYNCKVSAIAARSDLFPSSTTVFNVNWLTASAVQVAYSNGVLTLTCATPDAVIYYEIGGKDATKDSPLYTGPITLTDNREVRFVAYASGVAPVSGSYTPTDFACAPVTMTYDGLNIELATTEENATIYYTTDGSIPTTSSAVYTGKTPLIELCTVNAIAAAQYKNNSQVMTEPITYFFDGTIVSLSEAGRLADAVKWRGTEGLEEVTIKCTGKGTLNTSDLSALRNFKSLKHLNLKEVRFENNTVPDGAFMDMNLIFVEFPSTNITMITGDVFSGCKHLAAIVWMARVQMASTASSAGITNPNLLLYVDNKVYAPQGIKNVIANGSASSIILADDNGSFYCPQSFQAQTISYTHTYNQITGINKECRGWETIALPFDVQNITHEQVGKIAPFAANDATARSFWLGELSESGFKKASEIKAYTPYIISMPNNDVYGNSYILSGKVTFEAVNTTVPVTTIKTVSKGTHVFTPCFDIVEAAPSVFAINKNDPSANFVEGSVFMPSYRDVKPFEAYIAVPSSGVAPRYIPIFENDETGIMELQSVGIMELQNGTYDMTGRKVQGELKRGVYIVNGKKVIIK